MTGLLDQLKIAPPLAVSVVGGGGKTTLMYALAREALQNRLTVLTTTSTKIFPPTPDQSPCLILVEQEGEAADRIRAALAAHGHVTAARDRVPGGKLAGFSASCLDDLIRARVADLIIIEADGSRMLPLKAPGPNEPVIPAETGLTIALAGLAGLGRPLDDQTVFRPEIFSSLSGLALGEKITPAALARVLFHPQGLFKNTLPKAKKAVILNQADRLEANSLDYLAVISAEAEKRRIPLFLGRLNKSALKVFNGR